MKKNIIFIADNNHFRIWPGKTYYDLITYVAQYSTQYNITIFWTDDAHDIIVQAIDTIQPVLIVFFITGCIRQECAGLTDIFNQKIPVACAMLDMFFPYYGKTDYQLPDALIHIGKHTNIVSSYQTIFPKKVVTSFSSRFINNVRFKDYNLEKKYDILIYGNRMYEYAFKKENLPSIQEFITYYEEHTGTKVENDTLINFYYLRAKIENVLIKNRDKYNLKILPMSGIYNAKITNEYLSMLINQSRMTIACTTLCDVMMHKYLEIAASKSVIVGNIPSDYRELFEGNMIEITHKMTESEIIDKIDNALSDPEKLNSMSNRLYDKVCDEHNLDKAVSNFEDVFSEICEKVNKDT